VNRLLTRRIGCLVVEDLEIFFIIKVIFWLPNISRNKNVMKLTQNCPQFLPLKKNKNKTGIL
jgi:hypothetical protein